MFQAWEAFSRLVAMLQGNGSQHAKEVEYFSRPFEFLSLGLLAYVGSDQAVTQFEAGKANFSLAGYLSFLLWRSVYITKQVCHMPQHTLPSKYAGYGVGKVPENLVEHKSKVGIPAARSFVLPAVA